MTTRGRRRHSPEQLIAKLRDADAMLNAGKELAVALQALEISESTYERWLAQYGGMKAEAAKRLKELEDENRRLKQLVADLPLDNQKVSLGPIGSGRFHDHRSLDDRRIDDILAVIRDATGDKAGTFCWMHDQPDRPMDGADRP